MVINKSDIREVKKLDLLSTIAIGVAAIAAVILGGTSFIGGIGTITGTLIGALIIATLNNGMTLMGVSYFWQLVIKGGVIIIAVLIDKYRTRGHTA